MRSLQPLVDRFEQFLNEPIRFRARILMVLLVVPLALSYTQPLWRISMEAPQYPQGLNIDVYSYKLRGGHNNHDIDEINELNHYIGMRAIDPAALPELRLLPWILLALAAAALVAAALGKRRLVGVWLVAVALVGIAGVADLYRWSYTYGHDLDAEHAIIKMPGMVYQPPLVGSKQILNFTASSWPASGTWLAVAALIAGAAALMLSRRSARAPRGAS